MTTLALTPLRTITYRLPAGWGAYLIDGDASGFSDEEQAAMDRWLDERYVRLEIAHCFPIEVPRDPEEFEPHHDAWDVWPFACATERFTFAAESLFVSEAS